REDRGRETPVGAAGAPDQVGGSKVSLRYERAHLDIRQRAMLFPVARNVPLDVRLLAGHKTLLSCYLADSPKPIVAGQPHAAAVQSDLSAWRQCGSSEFF